MISFKFEVWDPQVNWHLLMHKVFGGLGGKRVWAAGLIACCNYFSKKKKKKKKTLTKS